jgi:succinoglycan biosynthesis transport protein ExoP
MTDLKNLDLAAYLEIFWRRKWYFLMVWVLVSAAAVFYARRQPLLYVSETRILIKEALIPEEYVRPTVQESVQETINAIRVQLSSRSFLERIIEEQQLFGFGRNPGFVMEQAVATLQGSLQVAGAGNSVVTLSYVSTDPRFAREVLRSVTNSLIRTNVASRRSVAVETDQFIDEQLRQALQDLNQQGDRIRQFKTTHLGELPEQSAANLNALTGLHTQLAAVENDIQRMQDLLKLLDLRAREQKQLSLLAQSLKPVGAPGRAEATTGAGSEDARLSAKRAQLAELAARYTAKHPDVMKLSREVEELERQNRAAAAKAGSTESAQELTPLGQDKRDAAGTETAQPVADSLPIVEVGEAEIRLEEENLKNQIAKRETEKEGLLRQIKDQQGRLNLAPALEQEYLTLSRERELLVQRYNNLQVKKFNAQMATANRNQTILLGIGAGFFLGLVAAFGREFLDPTITRPEEAATVLQLPVLVVIPELPAKPGRLAIARRGHKV